MNLKHSVAFGLVPSMSFITGFYIYYLTTQLETNLHLSHIESILLMTALYTTFILILKQSLTFLALMPYIGFKLPKYIDIIFYFIIYYVPLTFIINLITNRYIDTIGFSNLAIIPIVLMAVGYTYFKLKFAITVTFLQITPRVYVDLIKFELHTMENIKSYDVIAEFENNLDIERYLFGWELVRKEKIKFKGEIFNHSKIRYIDFEISEDDSYVIFKALNEKEELLWEDTIYFTKEYNSEKITYNYLESLAQAIMNVENNQVKK